jgi:hypothetical protein
MSDQDPCKCGHAMSFHRHDDDLLQMECGANPDCGHFSCRFPWTPTDFAPRPACDCKNWRAPVEPVPAPRLECDHTTEFYDEAGDSTRVLWSEDVIGYNYCPDCGTLLSAPPVGTQPKGD